jgi:hypothetical protein
MLREAQGEDVEAQCICPKIGIFASHFQAVRGVGPCHAKEGEQGSGARHGDL